MDPNIITPRLEVTMGGIGLAGTRLHRVLNVPFQLRFLFAILPTVIDQVLNLACRDISIYLVKRAGFTRENP